jgi:seryl-tRNA synthetase
VACTESPVDIAERAFRDELLQHGLFLATGVAGVYGYSAAFADTVEQIDRLVTAAAGEDHAEIMRFPPILNRSHFERSGYLKSFPHLAGAIHSFGGDEQAHRELLQAADDGGNWSAGFRAAEVVLTPAACYPVYPTLSGTLPPGGRLVDVMSYCFRHEPSADAGRMQMFRMREHVRAATADEVVAWREMWLDRAQALAAALGLDARVEVASDPFFGRGGKLLAVNQRDQRLKLEILAPISNAERPSAIISLNYHQDHFGGLFGIRSADAAVAHTSCVGFGLERIALALFRRHGLDRARWPAAVRGALRL